MWIYCITNKIDGKKYIGQCSQTDVNKRWWAHRSELKYNKHFNSYLQNAWNKYGNDSFEFSILKEDINSLDYLNRLEKRYIKEYKTNDRNFGYNLTYGGNQYKFTEDTIDKISKAQTKRYSKQSEREKMSVASFKRFSDPDERKKAGNRSRNNWHNYKKKMSKNLDNARIKANIAKQKTYTGFIDPDGCIYSPVINLTKFAKEHKLTRQSLYRVYTNQLNHHKGWIKYNEETI